MLEALRLSQLVAPLSAELIGHDVAFVAVSTDSRAINQGQLFIALSGPRFDGHAYLAEVAAKGAVAALVERHVADVALPHLGCRFCAVAVNDYSMHLGVLAYLRDDRKWSEAVTWPSSSPR
ncbi:MAG: hypothetical protein B7Z23_10570, partial [Pseudomonadales bacterium 32-61-5]